MEHEVYIPFPIGSVRAALADHERVARCVPGLQQDAEGAAAPEQGAAPGAGGGSLTGRMRVRIGGSTITYRGSLALTPREGADGVPDGFAVEGNGAEARGSGTVKLVLTVVPRPAAETDAADTGAADGTRLVCSGTVTGTGRIGDVEDRAAAAAGTRLLDRFGSALADGLRDDPPPVAGGIGAPGDNERAIPGIPEPESAEPGPGPESGPESGAAPEPEPEPERTGLFETDVPPSSLDSAQGGAPGAAEAEAAHARRTMIGRSAEEVDHAPPRGRYAPVPAPEPASGAATLRWAAPAAAVVVAGAVVLSRALRRRR
ncbi:hypothetical protein [Streptomyces boncukensis]|uniref:Carbon monoxide dehydrogenase subunit G n=1 Tax=Streptomyces boncukensis TaxID=2711219 RepID=A0A6G4X6T6_9ACTN|nr:hypothetical protein [Streptomyces boncukensis]NGO73098.1 hypothetical protein [Streptomyces boncukensis]